ncbi:MAG: zinc protease [Bradymonadia bacterium]|jgi:zinc protease
MRPTLDFVHTHSPALTVERYTLPNGLVLLYQPDPQATVFSYQTWFRVGGAQRHAGRTGLAHLFEHLMFKGTTTRPEGVFDRELESRGGRSNAATWIDWTYYHADLPSGHLDAIVDLEIDRLRNLELTAEKLEAERKVVVNERKECVDNEPSGLLSEALWSLALGDHPNGVPTIGWMHDIEALTLADCQHFHDTWYRPNNAIVVVAGGVEREHLLDVIGAAYGPLGAGPLPVRDAPVLAPIEAPRAIERSLAILTERLVMGFVSPSATDPRHPVLEIINEIMCEGDSALLQRALITDGELAASFYSFVPAFCGPGVFELSVELRPGHTADEAERVVLDVIATLARDGVPVAALEKARNRLETHFYRGLQTADQRAQTLGYWAVTAGDFRRMFTLGDAYRAVGVDDVKAVAAELLNPQRRVVVRARPKAQVAA